MPSRPVSASVREYARGLGGGLLFSLPLFYTMEVWAVGLASSPARLLALVAGTLALLVGYNTVAGIRDEHTLGTDLLESVEELGLGLLLAAGLMALLGRLPDDVWSFETLGLVTVQGLLAAVGVSVGTAQLGESPGDDEDADDSGGDEPADDEPADDDAGDASARGGRARELVVALCGAVLVAANVAPTEEVQLLVYEMTAPALIGLVALSLVVGAGLLYHSAVRGTRRIAALGVGPVRGTVVTYGVAVAASAALLWAFGQVDSLATLPRLVAVLALPAMIGASAGRLLLLSDGPP